MIAVSRHRHGSLGHFGQSRRHAALHIARRLARPGARLQQQWALLKSPSEVAAEAIEIRDEGQFDGVKLRLGREDPKDDLATIDAVRQAVGEDMHLMIDFNQGLDMAEALRRCHMLDDLGLTWLEEPVVYDNFDGYAQLARELKTPLADRRELLRTA